MPRQLTQAQENKPKKPLSGFFRFRMQQKEKLQKKYPDLDGRQILKLTAKFWNDLDDNKKEQYTDIYEKEFIQYQKDLQKWRTKYNIPSPKKSKSRRKSKKMQAKSKISKSKK